MSEPKFMSLSNPQATRFTQCRPEWATDQFARQAVEAVTGRRSESLHPLGGGFSNANFRMGSLVLRLYRGGVEVARREGEVLRLARRHGIPVPEVECVAEFQGRGLMLQQFVEGVAWSSRSDYAHLGETLALLHQVKFSSPGLFEPDGSLRRMPGGFGWDLFLEFLLGRAGGRLEPAVRDRLLSLQPPEPHQNPTVLVHSDFNSKNLLATSDGRVAAVLDWEFAMVNDPLIDLGNFLRFEDDHSNENLNRFFQGYRSAGGHLPEDWRRRSLLHDLVSLLAFLDSPQELPETFATARVCIARTLEALE